MSDTSTSLVGESILARKVLAKDALIAELLEALEEAQQDQARYRYIRDNMEWRRSGGGLADPESHAFVGCRFPYLANFSCAAMLDHNIDAMLRTAALQGEGEQ